MRKEYNNIREAKCEKKYFKEEGRSDQLYQIWRKRLNRRINH